MLQKILQMPCAICDILATHVGILPYPLPSQVTESWSAAAPGVSRTLRNRWRAMQPGLMRSAQTVLRAMSLWKVEFDTS